MRTLFLLFALTLALNTQGQENGYETLTYKTRKEDPAQRTLLQKLFPKNNPVAVPEENSVRARILVTGEASLYEVDDYPGKCFLTPGNKPFFFLKTAKGLFPLINRTQTGVSTDFQPYWGALMTGLGDWDEKKDRVDQLARSTNGFTAENLILLITAYNDSRKTSR